MSWRSSYYLSRKFWAGFYYRISSNSNRHSGIKNLSNKEQLLSRFIFISAFPLLSDQANQYKKNILELLMFYCFDSRKPSSDLRLIKPALSFQKHFKVPRCLLEKIQYSIIICTKKHFLVNLKISAKICKKENNWFSHNIILIYLLHKRYFTVW